MTAVSSVGSVATTEIDLKGHLFATDVYVNTMRELIRIGENNLKVAKQFGYGMITGYARVWEYHAVHVGGGRQTGKSKAISVVAESSDLVVVYNRNVEGEMAKLLKDQRGDACARHITAFELTKLIRTRLAGDTKALPFPRPRVIFIDDALYAFSSSKLFDARTFAKWLINEYPDNTPIVVCVG